MGYTHYLRNTAPIPLVVFTDAKLIIAKARAQGIVICGWDGTGEPTIDETGLRLNGDGSRDLDHETLVINDASFSFCKTARKPYDAVVGAILISVKDHVPEAEIGSDGVWEYDWDAARALYFDTFGVIAKNPLEK